jgi:hypothetical protein
MKHAKGQTGLPPTARSLHAPRKGRIESAAPHETTWSDWPSGEETLSPRWQYGAWSNRTTTGHKSQSTAAKRDAASSERRQPSFTRHNRTLRTCYSVNQQWRDSQAVAHLKRWAFELHHLAQLRGRLHGLGPRVRIQLVVWTYWALRRHRQAALRIVLLTRVCVWSVSCCTLRISDKPWWNIHL